MDWTAGYESSVEYTAGFYREQSPVYLNFVSVLNGYEPIPLDQSFNYLELGFGRGLTVNVLAAANPQGQFYAVDFNPSHVAGARQLANAAKLDNLNLLEASFEQVAAGAIADLPMFDFITLHGIYTWVTAENRQHIVNVVARYLKPGGIVYVSYNAMPGWAATLPLQRLLVEHAELHPNRGDAQVKHAADFVEQMAQAKASYFMVNSALKSRLAMLKTASPNYLVHEYMHKHWQPLYHIDVARDLSEAKMDYAGSADLAHAYPELYLNKEKQELINSLPDANLRETIKDYLLNTSFRKDVFIRGTRKMSPPRHSELLANIGIQLLVPREHVNLSLSLGIGEVKGKPELYNPVLDLLAEQTMTLAALLKHPHIKQHTLGSLAQIFTLLLASGQVGLYSPNRTLNNSAAVRMNQCLAEQTRYGDDYQVLTSPALGNGLNASFIERLTYYLISQSNTTFDTNSLVQEAWKMMQAQGRRTLKNGTVLETEADNLAELQVQMGNILTIKLPLWQKLQMI